MHSLVFSYSYDLHSIGLGEVVFFDTTRLKSRHDYELMADNFSGQLYKNVKGSGSISIRYSLDIKSVFKKTLLIFNLYNKYKYNIYDAVQISQLIMLNNLIGTLPTQLKKAITFCDAHPEDNLIAQSLKSRSINTYTLQHGYYVLSDESINSEVYLNFVSDYMLCWGESSVDNITLMGLERNKLIKFGCFKKNNNLNVSLKKNRVTLFLNGTHSSEDNYQLVSLYSQIKNQDKDIEVKIRRHPDDNNNYGLEEDAFDKLSLIESMSLTCYSVILSSGTFVDLYLNNIPFSILKTEKMPNEFKTLRQCGSVTEILSHINQRIFVSVEDARLIEKKTDWGVLK
ncbi:hypothetical protein [Vibrio variabilis]|nr:hypothetical protein [Vibrio variabilis]